MAKATNSLPPRKNRDCRPLTVMNELKQNIGIALVVAGALLLLLSKVVGQTAHNLVLLTGLIIIIGVVTHVKLIKSAEKY